MRLIVGAIGLSFVLTSWLGGQPAPSPPDARRGVFWGAVSGFTSAFANAGGRPSRSICCPSALPKLTLVAPRPSFFAVVNWLKVIPYVALGNFTSSACFCRSP